jgi:CRISPR-associated protein Csy1
LAAIPGLEAKLALAPQDARLCNDLGIAYADAGDTERAIAAFARATSLDPTFARGWNNLGTALTAAGRADGAADAYSRAVAVDVRYALAWANLGATRRDLGDDSGAEAALRQALALDPSQPVALAALAAMRRHAGHVDEAVRLYARALQKDPRDAGLYLQLGSTLAERDDLERAEQAFNAARSLAPSLLRAAFGRHLTLPMVADNAAALARARLRYADGLDRLAEEIPAAVRTLTSDKAVDELRWCNFLLGYHGEDDLPLQRRYGDIAHAVLVAAAPEWMALPSRRTPTGGRTRVGFASAFFRDGTAGRYFEHWITDLPRDRFEVIVYHLQPHIDALGARLAARADALRHFPRPRPSQVAPAIRGDDLDVLVFPELGMDATTFALAAMRLAPTQCAAWGHPVTTGHPTVDVFLTCEAMEPPGADTHYSERLVRLPGIGTRYTMPESPRDGDRARFGLPAAVPLFLFPQSLFKIHPDNDALVARVLAAVPEARLVMFQGRHPVLTAKLLARLAAACAAAGVDHASRIHVLAHLDHADYLRLNCVCDAMLDTLRWSGGNTSLDALACALPIVTLPGTFMRGRQSAAMLEQAGVPELVARDQDDYVAIATRLAVDPAWRASHSARLRSGRDAVFDDSRPIAALAETLRALA